MEMLILMIAAHFVCDTVLQPEHVSKQKIPKWALMNNFNQTTFHYVMLGHAATHAFAVYFITGQFWFFLVELVGHFTIDLLKIGGAYGRKYNMHIDQGLHLAMKVVFFLAVQNANLG